MQKRSPICIKRTAGNGRMDDGLNCGRNVPGSTRQTNALSFYSLGNEVDKGRSRTAPLIYKSIVIGRSNAMRERNKNGVANIYGHGIRKPQKNNTTRSLSGCYGVHYSLERMDEAYCAVLCSERERQKTDSTGNDAAHVTHAELVRFFRRGHRGCPLRQLCHEVLSED